MSDRGGLQYKLTPNLSDNYELEEKVCDYVEIFICS